MTDTAAQTKSYEAIYESFVKRALKENTKDSSKRRILLKRSFGQSMMDALEWNSKPYLSFVELHPVMKTGEGWTERKAAQFFTAQVIMYTRSTATGKDKRRMEQVLAKMYKNESDGIRSRILKILSLDMDETGCLERALSGLIRLAMNKGYAMKNLNFEQLIYDLATWNRDWAGGSKNRWGEIICGCWFEEEDEEESAEGV